MGSQRIRYDWVTEHASNNPHYICLHNFFIYSSGGEHLVYFHVLAIVNNAFMTWGCRYLFELVFLFPLDKYPEVKLWAHMVVMFSIIHWVSPFAIYQILSSFSGTETERQVSLWVQALVTVSTVPSLLKVRVKVSLLSRVNNRPRQLESLTEASASAGLGQQWRKVLIPVSRRAGIPVHRSTGNKYSSCQSLWALRRIWNLTLKEIQSHSGFSAPKRNYIT